MIDAFRDEAERLSEAMRRESETAFGRPSTCPPWNVAELLNHVRIAVGRLTAVLTSPEPEPGSRGAALVDAVGYYRPDHRFSPATNADRVGTAQRHAAGLATATEAVRYFEQDWRRAWALTLAAPPDRVVRTRHGDQMLLIEFLRTRVVELAVHGLDLAASLDRDPWMTAQAASLIEDLILPAGTANAVRAETGWDRITLIAKVTRRRPLTDAEAAWINLQPVRWLTLG